MKTKLIYYKNSLEKLPTIISENGIQKYYENDKLHRPSLEGSGSHWEIPS
ncbi:MAG: hypothetical protein JKX76_00700 [Colwellia sp.]|nr:hypothetical protein [Colwellia sp.]